MIVNLYILVGKVNMYLEFLVRDDGKFDVVLVNFFFNVVNRLIEFQIQVSNWLKVLNFIIFKIQNYIYKFEQSFIIYLMNFIKYEYNKI